MHWFLDCAQNQPLRLEVIMGDVMEPPTDRGHLINLPRNYAGTRGWSPEHQ